MLGLEKEVNFTLGEQNSSSWNLVIEDSDHLDDFERDIEVIPIDGGDGDVVVDNGGYSNKEITVKGKIICEGLKMTPAQVVVSFRKWIKGDIVDYRMLKFSDDEEFYDAITIGKVKAKEIIDGIIDTEFTFTCKRREVE